MEYHTNIPHNAPEDGTIQSGANQDASPPRETSGQLADRLLDETLARAKAKRMSTSHAYNRKCQHIKFQCTSGLNFTIRCNRPTKRGSLFCAKHGGKP